MISITGSCSHSKMSLASIQSWVIPWANRLWPWKICIVYVWKEAVQTVVEQRELHRGMERGKFRDKARVNGSVHSPARFRKRAGGSEVDQPYICELQTFLPFSSGKCSYHHPLNGEGKKWQIKCLWILFFFLIQRELNFICIEWVGICLVQKKMEVGLCLEENEKKRIICMSSIRCTWLWVNW